MEKLSDNRVCFDEDMTVPEMDAELHAAGLLRVGYPENVEGVVIYTVTTVAADAAERAQFAPFFTPEVMT